MSPCRRPLAKVLTTEAAPTSDGTQVGTIQVEPTPRLRARPQDRLLLRTQSGPRERVGATRACQAQVTDGPRLRCLSYMTRTSQSSYLIHRLSGRRRTAKTPLTVRMTMQSRPSVQTRVRLLTDHGRPQDRVARSTRPRHLLGQVQRITTIRSPTGSFAWASSCTPSSERTMTSASTISARRRPKRSASSGKTSSPRASRPSPTGSSPRLSSARTVPACKARSTICCDATRRSD